MDGQAGIEFNRQALLRILAALVAMAGFGPLPRHLHRAILRLLRPAESAARRLIIAASLGMTVSPWRARVKKAASRQVRHFAPKMPVEPAVRSPLRQLALPLADAPRGALRHAIVRQASIPRLWISGSTQPRLPVPAPLGPDDPLDATRLGLRLDALGHALDDLPRQALRFARWRARRAAQDGQKTRRRWPLKPGRPPGSCPGRRAAREVHDVLTHCDQLARWALEQRIDTS